MKSVLISIQPKWVEKIASGEKTIEVRKSKPKLETPFKCYIYCTKGKKDMFWVDEEIKDMDGLPKGLKVYNSRLVNCSVVGEFVCEKIDEWKYLTDGFVEDENEKIYYISSAAGHATCLTYDEIENYGKGKPLYGWHISNLKIYEKPKELSEFKSVKVIRRYQKKEYDKYEKLSHAHRVEVKYLERPPQSWCYVESLGE